MKCVRVCVRVCARACVRACLRARARVCVCMCVCFLRYKVSADWVLKKLIPNRHVIDDL